MTLAQRRQLAEIEAGAVARRAAELAEVVGKPVALEVDLASFVDTPDALTYLDENVLRHVVTGIRVTCQDKIGKDAFAAAVDKGRVLNKPVANEKSLVLADKVLTVTVGAGGSWEGAIDSPTIVRFLGANL
jgi:hypothetical protein